MNGKHLTGWTMAALLSVSAAAQAGFIGGVDGFTGTSLDTGTWVSVSRQLAGVTFVQNNELQITTDGGSGRGGDYTTISLQVGVGQQVTAEVTPTGGDSRNGQIGLWLTNDSTRGVVGKLAANDTMQLAVSNSDFVGWGTRIHSVAKIEDDVNTGASANIHGANVTLVYGIARLSSTSARFTVFNPATSSYVLDVTRSWDAGGTDPEHSAINDSMYIALYTYQTNVDFDNVRVTAIPEPASLGLLGLGALATLWRRR